MGCTPSRVSWYLWALYLYGERTRAAIYPTLDEVTRLIPRARFRCLRGQRHLAPVFDPATFARAVLDFTTAHDG